MARTKNEITKNQSAPGTGGGAGATVWGSARILLGVTGGIAAYKSAEIVRLLVKDGFDVHVVMTRNAREFITPMTLQALSGNPVWTDTFHLGREQGIGHIALVERGDLFLIAPATANVLGKAAAGIADDLLMTMLCAAARIPVVFAPSMNKDMYANPITRGNIAKLKRHGYHFIDPEEGDLACGVQGPGRLPDPETIVEHVRFWLSPKDLKDETILVTAGPTQEAIDAVRYISNPSSGKMGFALARAAAMRGARVTLVSGPTNCPRPLGVRVVEVRSAEQMRRAAMKVFPESTSILMAAAVSDFRPLRRAGRKLKKDEAPLKLELVRTPDILLEMGRKKGKRILIGFAAETESLVSNAVEKLKKKKLDLVVANDVSRKDAGFQSDMNQVKLVWTDGGVTELPLMSKALLAHRILDQIPVLREKVQREEEAASSDSSEPRR